MSLVIPVSKSQLKHTADAVMTGIHNIFPSNNLDDGDDPISEKKLKKLEGQYSTEKTLLGFDFDGTHKTMWLEAGKCEKLLTILRGWTCTGRRGTAGIPFKEFESTVAKIRHAFTCNPMGSRLLSSCNCILKLKPAYVYLNRNERLLTSLEGCRLLLRESTKDHTRCSQLIQVRVPGFHWFCRRLGTWRGRGHNWRIFPMYSHSFLLAVAARCSK